MSEDREMGIDPQANSPSQEELAQHYESGYEAKRHHTRRGKLDAARTRELMKRFLPSPPAVIRDVGGGPGGHACWLAKLGYEVHLIDIVPLHVELTRQASEAQPEHPIASVLVGDARSLPWAAESSDAVLLFGPLYHLTKRDDRIIALREAHRVLRKNGVIMAVGISRFASAFDGLLQGFIKDPVFVQIVEGDLRDGQHRNATRHPDYFMDTFFHHPDELRSELASVGFSVEGVIGVEGPGWLLQDFNKCWNDESLRDKILWLARSLESEPTLLGLNAHLMAVGRKP